MENQSLQSDRCDSGGVDRDNGGVYRRAFMIGSGFFTVALIEPMYSAYVPLMLADYLHSSVGVGAVLSALNLIAPAVIPVFSTLSDRTVTRIGRRMPYIVTFLPLAALALALVPIAARLSLTALVGVLAAMNFFRHAARGPIVALMPDLVPREQRSQANGVINTMGGLAAITATVFLAPLIGVQLTLPVIGAVTRVVPFWFIALLVVSATLFLFNTVREPVRSPGGDPGAKRHGRVRVFSALAAVVRSGRSGALPILLAVVLWFLGWKLMTPFISLYVRDYLRAGEAAAGFSFGVLALALTSFAVPGGVIAARLGRRRVMCWALLMLAVFGLAAFCNHRLALQSDVAGLYPFWATLFGFGIAWSVLITNCLPMLWDRAGPNAVGLYTGLYYFASQTALVAGPGVGGVIVEFAGFGGLFLAFSSVMLAAFVLLRQSRL